ncbi:hypothetical protein Gohar_021714, partial [Gossypium harknessii]|nr:hypothetical protein [Gossypium harknessii]
MANSLCDSNGSKSHSIEDRNTKKERFKDNNANADMDMVVELPHEPMLSWKDRLTEKGLIGSRRSAGTARLEDDDDFKFLERDVTRSTNPLDRFIAALPEYCGYLDLTIGSSGINVQVVMVMSQTEKRMATSGTSSMKSSMVKEDKAYRLWMLDTGPLRKEVGQCRSMDQWRQVEGCGKPLKALGKQRMQEGNMNQGNKVMSATFQIGSITNNAMAGSNISNKAVARVSFKQVKPTNVFKAIPNSSFAKFGFVVEINNSVGIYSTTISHFTPTFERPVEV